MAAVLDALAPYVKKLIMDMAEEEVSKLLGVSDEINKLGDKVESMEAYVADAERRRISDSIVQRWVSKLKGALYEATDILELCQLDAEERRAIEAQGGCMATMETKAPGCLLPFLFCLRKPRFAHAMGGRIKDLNMRLDGIYQEMAGLNLQALTTSPVQTPPSEALPPSRTTTSFFDESALVGEDIEADTKGLVQELLVDNGPLAMKVVSITAAGGMGKTTLAKKIFNDRDVKAEFKCRIWLSVTESYSHEKLLSSAINQARGGDNHNHHGDQQVLTQTLVCSLSEAGKFLLVLDDLWSERPWNDILQSPVVEAGIKQPGSRVIITTRNEDLVKDMRAPYHLHHIKPLSDEDAWTLLKKQLLPMQGQDVRGDETALDHLKHIGMKIVRNCDGLPLAIKAIGGLLRTKGATEHVWRGVLHDPTWMMDKPHDDLNTVLRLSYEDLPPQLKQCFLYLSILPKGFIMEEGLIIGMWMSQGFLRVPATSVAGQKELEDIGMGFYRDLIRRNLIEPDEYVRNEPVCRMHDVLRSFGRYMAREEALSVDGADQLCSLSSPELRHLSISPNELESESLVLPQWGSIPENQKCLRSLIIYGCTDLEPSSDDSSLSRFPSLRALFMCGAQSNRFLESIGKLKHLRFLYLYGINISKLPDDMGKMKFLEYIFLLSSPSFDGQIPHSILRLERLRHLIIGLDTKFNIPKGLGGLTNLRTLQILPAQMDGEWCSLQELGQLSQLRVLTIGCLEAVPSALLAAKAKICEKRQLRVLALLCYKLLQLCSSTDDEIRDMTHDKCQQMEEVVDQLCPPPALENLSIQNYVGHRPPSWMCVTATANFNSLVFLEMQGLPFCTELPDGLCRLPSLETLLIEHALAIRRVGPEFQRQTAASSTSVRTWSFPRLQFLRFKVLPEWEEWEWEEEAGAEDIIAMPSLEILYIGECKLLHLPAGLASSRRLALRKLILDDAARITALESFPSVVELFVMGCPSVKTIRGFPRMQIACIVCCPALEVLEAGPALDTVELRDPDMETLPEYLRGLQPRLLDLDDCHQKLCDLLLLSRSNGCSSADEYKAEMDKVKLKQGGKFVVRHELVVQGEA